MAVHGLMMLSDGETYCLALGARDLLAGQRGMAVMDGAGDDAAATKEEEESESEIRDGTGEGQEEEQDEASELVVLVGVLATWDEAEEEENKVDVDFVERGSR